MSSTILNHYKLVDKLGDGSFGTVYMARDLHNNRTVAVKILHPGLSVRADFVDNLLEEARILRSLGHPHIVELYNFGKAGDSPYLVMEYLEGHDLRDVLDSDGTLVMRRAMHICVQVADALAAAADLKLVHCDIKPENIRLLRNDDVKLMDFGISRTLDSQQRLQAGTWSYMAPELWCAAPPGHAADIYALGCVLYELFTGRPPFCSNLPRGSRDARDEIKRHHMGTQPDWTPLEVDAIPPGLVDLLQAMLGKSPDYRPTVREVCERLRNLADDVSSVARLPRTKVSPIVDDETRPHEATVPPDAFQRHDSPTPGTPADDAVIWPASHARTPVPVVGQVVLQQTMTPVDLGGEACRTLLVHDDKLITASPDGAMFSIDLRTHRVQRWSVIPRDQVHSHAWALLGHRSTLLVHPGGTILWLLQASNGQVRHQVSLPEPTVTLVGHREWLYASSSRSSRLHRAAWPDLASWETFDLPARPTGTPLVTHSAVYLPTSQGLVVFDPQVKQATMIEPRQTARAVAVLHHEMVAVLYVQVSEDNLQTSIVRLFATPKHLPRLLTETQAPGQNVGSLLAAGSQLFLTCRSGQVWSCAAVERDGDWHLDSVWSWQATEGHSIQGGAAFSNDILALAPSSRHGGELVLLEAATGRRLCAPQSLTGEAFIAPAWWERTVSVLNAKGTVDSYRMILVSEQ